MDNVNEQIKALAKAHEDGIDTVAAGIQDLYQIVDVLSNQLRTADVLLAALKYMLIKKKVATEEEILSLVDKITTMSNKSLTEQQEQPKKEEPTAVTMEQEIKMIHEAAKKAGESPYDVDAFIFGS